MTTRLYYHDATTATFQAHILETTTHDGRPAAILAETYFYPTGGGQPHDLGMLNDRAVVEVMTREDGALLHILDFPAEVGPVIGKIDWSRRFDFMQQHSGQHILSRAFEIIAEAATIGFHLTESSLTIDVDKQDVPLAEVEKLANEVVFAAHPIRAWFPDADELAALQLRKISEKAGDSVRVVQIGEFDRCACGGTHVTNSGQVGLIKITRIERLKKGLRVEFKCGGRALSDYEEKNRLLLDLAAKQTLGWREIPTALERIKEDNKALTKELKAARETLLRYEADELFAAMAGDGLSIVNQVWQGRPVGELQTLARHLARHSGTIALLGSAGEKAALVFATAEDSGCDAAALLRESLAQISGAKGGGGSPTLAQAGGFSADEGVLRSAIEAVRAQINVV